MGLKLPLVYKRANSENWWAKKDTPLDLWNRRRELAAIGVTVIRVTNRSMGTANKKAALAEEVKFLAELECKFDSWRSALKTGPRVLNDQEQWAIVTAVSKFILISQQQTSLKSKERNQDNWRKLLKVPEGKSIPKAIYSLIDLELQKQRIVSAPSSRDDIFHKLIGFDMDEAKRASEEASHLNPPNPEWETEGDIQELLESLVRRSSTGNYSEPEFLQARPNLETLANTQSYSFDDLVNTWSTYGRGRETIAVSSVDTYRQQAKSLTSFLGHSNPAIVSFDDAERYHNFLLEPRLDGTSYAPRQIRYILSNLSTLYARAIKARKLNENPFSPVVPPKPKRNDSPRMRGFTDDEAITILKAARNEANTWKRWGPWLMAYGGMRLTEASQLRTQDITLHEAGHFITLDPFAGHVKSGIARLVPIHQALIQEGFLEFVKAVSGERLFPHVCLDEKGNRMNARGVPNDSKAHKLSEWVRKLGIGEDDETIAPNHGWRHRFSIVAIMAQIDQRAIDRVIGHSDGHVREVYQNNAMYGYLADQFRKFPTLEL